MRLYWCCLANFLGSCPQTDTLQGKALRFFVQHHPLCLSSCNNLFRPFLIKSEGGINTWEGSYMYVDNTTLSQALLCRSAVGLPEQQYHFVPHSHKQTVFPLSLVSINSSLVPRPSPSFPSLAVRTESNGKLGEGLGTRLGL